MKEWIDPRYAELVQHWRDTTPQPNHDEAQPPTGRGFIITPPGTE